MKKIIPILFLMLAINAVTDAQSCSAGFYKFPDSTLSATFRVSSSFDPSYSLYSVIDFGDGTSASRLVNSSEVVHVYSNSGWYVVSRSVVKVDIRRDTVCSDVYTDSIPVGFIHNTGCSVILEGGDTISTFSYTAKDIRRNYYSPVPVFEHSLFIINGQSEYVSYTGQVTSGNHGHFNFGLTLESSGPNEVCLYKKYRDADSGLVCEAYDCKTIYVNSDISAWSAINKTQLTTPNGQVNFSCTYGSSSFDSTKHQEVFWWNFGDGGSSQLKFPNYHYTAAGTYVVKLRYIIRDKSSLEVFASGLSTDTVTILPSNECASVFDYRISATIPLQLSFANMSRNFYNPGTTEVLSHWDFGDGNTSVVENPHHLYTAAGTYQVSLITSIIDSARNTVCTDTLSKTVIAGPANISCNALFTVDTAGSSSGNITLVNQSTPTQANTNHNVSHIWSFGDGSYSYIAFPSHTYASAGLYQVCLSINVVDSLGRQCYKTFCDSLGTDTLGNLIFKKGSAGFTINVVDPSSVSQNEYTFSAIEIFPNPASDRLGIKGLSGPASWSIYNLSGGAIARGSIEKGQWTIPLPNVTNGLYVLNIKCGATEKNIKLQIER